MYIGFTLGFCIQDMIRDLVKEEEVERFILTSIISDREEWLDYVQAYRNLWKEDPDRGIEIATRLYDAGKICQPRLQGLEPQPFRTRGGWWLKPSTEEWVNFPR